MPENKNFDPNNASFKEKKDYFEKLSSAKKDADKKSKDRPDKITQDCKKNKIKIKIKIVELVEVVRRAGKQGTVGGVTMKSADKNMKELVKRRPQNGEFRQYINLDKDLEGADKRHPEYGRHIELRARIERVDGSKKGLEGKKVHWNFETIRGAHRDSQLKSGQTDLHKDENAFFEGGTGLQKSNLITETDEKGWSKGIVKFHFSQYGSDKFTVKAQADEENKGTPSGKKLSAGQYVVWRRFWYQSTIRKGVPPPDISQSVTAYDEVFAEMKPAGKNTCEFEAKDLNIKKAGKAAVTLYKEFMFKVKGDKNKDVVVIGRHNEKIIRQFFYTDKKEPVKAHLMFCDYQCDPRNTPPAAQSDITIDSNPSGEIAIASVDTSNQETIISPALGGKLVHGNSTWKQTPPGLGSKIYAWLVWLFSKIGLAGKRVKLVKKSGTFKDQDIIIERDRSALNCVKVRLTGEAEGLLKYKVKITLRLSYAEGFLGDNDGNQSTVVIGKSGTSTTVSHEIGHGFHQTPKSSDAGIPKSLKPHTNQYLDFGSHCSKGATPDGSKFRNGPCVMATRSSKKNRKYCEVCQPYVRLQEMKQMETPRR
jgi:hypothetical protein